MLQYLSPQLIMKLHPATAPPPGIIGADKHDLAKPIFLHCDHGHFSETRFARWIGIDEQDFCSRFGARDLGHPIKGRQLFPERDVLFLFIRQAQHGAGAARAG